MTPPLIEVSGVSKAYRVFDRQEDRLKELLFGRFKRWHRQFWAIRDVGFSVARGEAVGIIGRNGSGKSTLLQMIAGTSQPTSGSIKVGGRVAALLQLGAGFDPNFTGIENYFLNAAIIGIAQDQAAALLPQVLEFADIGDFVHQPVKTYSSGMYVRLAFSIQIGLTPDILIVDEALAVGDVFFQQKCYRRLDELRKSGMTLLFVSHDLPAVQRICDRAILLDKGRVAFEGAASEAVSRYYSSGFATTSSMRASDRASENAAAWHPDADWAADVRQHSILDDARGRHGTGRLKIVAAAVRDESGHRTKAVQLRSRMTVELLIKAVEDIDHPTCGIHLYDRFGTLVFAAGTRQKRVLLPAMKAGEQLGVAMQLTFNVQPGEYTFSLGCSEPSADGPNVGVVHDRHEGLGPIVVFIDKDDVLPFYGVADLPMSIEPPAQGRHE
jgi:ABC-type polysaccharide/polyol phosphate transport system ATPase subunit